jgi:uncharacterized protein (DUF305 family)
MNQPQRTMGVALFFAAVLTTTPTWAQQHAGHDSSSSQAYHGAMEKMNQQMNAQPMKGDADQDFVMMMIPHHQAAIDMAKVQLQYGKDPELRRMSEELVKKQEKDIAELKQWMAKKR